jgi:hypothetical protein
MFNLNLISHPHLSPKNKANSLMSLPNYDTLHILLKLFFITDVQSMETRPYYLPSIPIQLRGGIMYGKNHMIPTLFKLRNDRHVVNKINVLVMVNQLALLYSNL